MRLLVDGGGYATTRTAFEDANQVAALQYDALTGKRVYKPAFHHQVAKSIIVKAAGTQFDPGVVEAFLAVEPQFVAIRERYDDLGGATAAAA